MKNIKTVFRLLSLTKSLLGVILIAVFLGVLGFLCAEFITILGGYALLEVLGIGNMSLKIVFALMILAALLRGVLHYGEQYANHYLAFKLLARMRSIIFEKLRKLCPAKLECREKGELISIITSDIELIEVFYAHTISPVLIAIIMSCIMTIFIGQFHIVLGGLALLGYITVGVSIPAYIAKSSGKIALESRMENGRLNSYILETLYGLQEIIQFKGGERRLKGMEQISENLLEKEEEMKVKSGVNVAITTSAVTLFPVIVLAVSTVLYMNNEIGIQGVLIGTLAMFSSFAPVIALANLGSGLQPTMAAAKRVLDLLDEEPVVEEQERGEKIDFQGVTCLNVNFSYEEKNILEGVSFCIDSVGIVGIQGESGSGKSTLLKLLMRFWDRTEGEILVSDTDIKNVNTKSLRDAESMLSQETVLFHDTIEYNIKIAKLDATREEVKKACKKASIHEFILRLPNGYETQVGELGDTLSGGERQRIGLARAFLHEAPFLLFDEPTSNLDVLNEAVILQSLKEASKEKTILLVSHRPSTMNIVDQLFQMESGNIERVRRGAV